MWRYVCVFIMSCCVLPMALAVNINTATIDELVTIKGIGEKTAKRIIAERERAGDFRSLDDFSIRVRGIGKKRVEKFKQQGLSVSGDNHAASHAHKDKSAKKRASGKRQGGSLRHYEASPKQFLVRPPKGGDAAVK